MDDYAHSEDEALIEEHHHIPPALAASAGLAQDKTNFADWLRDQRVDTYKRDDETNIDGLVGGSSTPGSKQSDHVPVIISSPREYQTELFERAKEKNVIVVLDTGAGKTLIAALLLRHIVEKELDDRKAGYEHRLAFFLVDKVALVHQQYSVLEANLDFPIDAFTGDSGAFMYTQDFWKETRNEKTIIVCTAEVLNQCLRHSYVRMEHINLLIFDEAHHAKKNHPYARIVKDFYATLESGDHKRPRILGMTASPVDAKTDIHAAAAQLEGLLHCEIATVDDPTVFSRAAINKPAEGFIEYHRIKTSFETVFCQKLRSIIGSHPAFSKILTYSGECTTELGRWLADRVWKLWLTREEAERIEAKTERDIERRSKHGDLLQFSNDDNDDTEIIRQAFQLTADHSPGELHIDPFHLSHKLIRLIEHLQEHFDPERDKCVIFAEQRLTVALLTDLFQQPGLKRRGYKAGRLMGSTNGNSVDLGMSLAEQKLSIKQFRNGELNCLFATSAGEEGIDIPDCNIVIRFDLYKTVIQYIQSRGRARQLNSKFYSMVEAGNFAHRQLIAEIEDHEDKLRDFCRLLPQDRLITGYDYDIEYHLSKEKSYRTYKVPSTGAVLNYKGSIAVLANFVSSLPHPPDALHRNADYIIHHVGGEFQCEVVLPNCSPIKSAIGRRVLSKQIAKCSAAFEMCLKLKKQKHLDDYLRSVFTKRLPVMQNARLAISSKKRAEYPMKRKPNAWSVLGFPDKLFVTVITLQEPKALGRPSRPLALLTRHLLPRTATFPIFFGNERTSCVECTPLSAAMDCRSDEVEALNQFTLRIFKDVFSKEYVSDAEKMPYFLAPLSYSHDAELTTSCRDSRTVIDWDCIRAVQNTPGYIEWETQSEDVFKDKFVVDTFDGSRKFYTKYKRPDLRPTDPQLPGLPRRHRSKDSKEVTVDIWSSSISSLFRNVRNQMTRRDDLPVIEAEYLPLRRNLLDQFDINDKVDTTCFLVLQVFKISPLPIDVVAMAYNLPAIIYRIESSLIAFEACTSMGLGLPPALALEALTKDSDNTEEHSCEQVNLQRGMGNNYERLEFLGDAFLKMSTTISLFSQIPDSDEFQHHVDRMVLVCNRNLFNNALEMKLEESIRSKALDRSNWYPLGLEILRGRRYKSQDTHALADKSIADVCEAIIGAAYMATHEQRNFDLAIQAVTKFVNHRNHKMNSWGEYYATYKIPEWQSSHCRAVHLNLAAEIEKKLAYKFRFPRLLRSAFTHPSYGSIYEGIPNYQRLEFLGDALLDMLCVDYLFHRFPGADPQWLTEHKMAMVSNQFLGCLCVSLSLQKHMVSMTGGLQKEVAEYVMAITVARTQAEDGAEAAGLGRAAYARNFWMEEKRPPKCLPDIVESYIGAVFVDSEYNFNEVQRFFDTNFLPYFENMELYDTYANNHPVTLLSYTLATEFHCTKWRIMCSETDDEERGFAATKVVAAVMIHGVVRESAYSDSSRYAKMRASQKLLKEMKEMSMEEFKTSYRCDCKLPNC
ncbi:hypothetical protein F4808DRAFT_474130 [Astrocystis sublimbata]|nr:hypothetical protein F4808DRAFT_474130 [Astrocystis sublimbata]